ncbi:P-loop containing nucleoside triphosphate hydrolase protein [Cylindrobasidium torrendii FP15055 ss-10]|uniref:p-loop containing nucleoside triphosphate hydrolase protein n=1 Tax=Cylindrobasidium torrendii FP15055 ss-10 TaxID=1314674 RepID=A0A0D7BKL4_9AGAR|nr:P-loop containing nucleoside triphosphate hydrolase protein [Cylindrobasidium torrendii FP15055 ss-10]
MSGRSLVALALAVVSTLQHAVSARGGTVWISWIYAFLLTVTALVSTQWSSTLSRHANLLYFATFAVYFAQDIFPLMTFTLPVQDADEGILLWVKVALVTSLGVLYPLVVPRVYTAIDAENSSPPNPEQTASVASFATCSHMDSIVAEAFRVPHLPYDRFPPLPYYDEAHYVKKHTWKNVDPFAGAPKRHLFFGLMKSFSGEYAMLATMILLHSAFSMVSPVGLNRLLAYLETDGEDAIIRPFVWILLLFLGPLFSSITINGYFLTSLRLVIRGQAVVTQLIYEHALRIRMTASTDEQSKSSNLVGMIMNLITADADNIISGRDFFLLVFYIPPQVALCMAFLYQILGWSSLVGAAFLLVAFPIPGMVARWMHGVQKEEMEKGDARIQSVTEVVGLLRMIKMFAWERKMAERVADKREAQLVWMRRRLRLEMVNTLINFLIPILTMLTHGRQTIGMHGKLTASIVFSSMSVFDILRNQLEQVMNFIAPMLKGKVSLDRMTDFLHNTELIDRFESTGHADHVDRGQAMIGFEKASFSWFKDTTVSTSNKDDIVDSDSESTSTLFRLRIQDRLAFKTGGLNIIVGPTGSGKTSMLVALLGEMHFEPLGDKSWYNLPRSGGVAYAAQESWVLNETIKDNILFGEPLDEERYKAVLFQCGLERDLGLFEAGDMTEVGEKGLTLSGGQKARVTLARAIYSRAEIILLDDILAALDVHTAHWVVQHCLAGQLVRGRTVILVTHNVKLVRPIAYFVVSIKHGRVDGQGTPNDVLGHVEIADEEDAGTLPTQSKDAIFPAAEAGSKDRKDGKLTIPEEINEGLVGWDALKLLFDGMSGGHAILFFATVFGGYGVTEALNVGQAWWLGFWASKYEDGHQPEDVSALVHVGSLGGFTVVTICVYALNLTNYNAGALRAARTIHRRLMDSVLGTTLRWLDMTPASRIIARCTQDIHTIDGPIISYFALLVQHTMMLLVKMVSIVVVTPVFILPSILVAAAGGLCGHVYVRAQMSVKREMANAKAPLLAHFGAAISGLTSVRAYGAQDAFVEESMRRINKYTRATKVTFDLNRWIGIRVDALGGVFAAALAAWMVYFKQDSAAITGFSLNQALAFSGIIIWWVRLVNEFEVQGNSLERINDYLNIEQEPKPSVDGQPPAYWPSSGRLDVQSLNAKYSKGGATVLRDVSFTIKSGERVGVVGRTGSGKSSLTLSLLRLILTDGEMVYDGIETSALNLDAVRSNITIIPQMPELLSGTLRENLNPFEQYDDAMLNDALKAAGLTSIQAGLLEGRMTLDTEIASGGGNLSVGQRQILALARALVKRNKVLVLDEATSAIDDGTDEVIQASLRTQLKKDTTVIIVAHRLQTIMDADKIMVLDAGRLVEFDSPKALLQAEGSLFRGMVERSKDKGRLFSLAGLPT